MASSSSLVWVSRKTLSWNKIKAGDNLEDLSIYRLPINYISPLTSTPVLLSGL